MPACRVARGSRSYVFEKGRNEVLSGVLLHVVKASRPVDHLGKEKCGVSRSSNLSPRTPKNVPHLRDLVPDFRLFLSPDDEHGRVLEPLHCQNFGVAEPPPVVILFSNRQTACQDTLEPR